MRTTFVSTLALWNSSKTSLDKLQTGLVKANKELVTGREADVGLKLGYKTGQTLSLRQDRAEIDALVDSNASILLRMKSSTTALDQIRTNGRQVHGRAYSDAAEFVEPFDNHVSGESQSPEHDLVDEQHRWAASTSSAASTRRRSRSTSTRAERLPCARMSAFLYRVCRPTMSSCSVWVALWTRSSLSPERPPSTISSRPSTQRSRRRTLSGVEASRDPVTGNLVLKSTDLTGKTDVTGSFTDVDGTAIPVGGSVTRSPQAAVASAFMSTFGFGVNDAAVSTITPGDMKAFLDGPFAALFEGTNWQDWSNASSQNIQSKISATEKVEASANANDRGHPEDGDGLYDDLRTRSRSSW